MSKQNGLTEELAVRIGLAARALPGNDVQQLMFALVELLDLPLTAVKLESVTMDDLQEEAKIELSALDEDCLAEALSYLHGKHPALAATLNLPEIQPALNDSTAIKVACASNNADLLDGHFGSCLRFLVYEVTAGQLSLVDIRNVTEAPEDADKNAWRAKLIDDCQVLYVGSIGGPAAAKVVRAGIHPIKHPDVVPALEAVQRLQTVIGDGAPPWLAKIMGATPEERIRCADLAQTEEA
jgi:nitrogen fixation protein NifX